MGIWDLGIFEQSLYNTLHGCLMSVTINAFEPVSLFTQGIYGAMFAVLPIYALFPCSETLFVVQAVVIAAGAFPVYLISHTILDRIQSDPEKSHM